MTITIRKMITLMGLAAILFGPSVNAQDDFGLNRLFTDEITRQELDQARQQYQTNQPSQQPESAGVENITLPGVTLNGAIIRSNGNTDVWVNNTGSFREDNVSQQVKDISKRIKGDQFELELPGGDKIKLRPGQIYSLETGLINESHERARKAEPTPDLTTDTPAEDALEEEIAETEGEEETEEEFDESELVEQDFKIKLLEERIERLEQSKPDTPR